MAIEFTAMEIFHHALRRDLAALEADFDRDRWRNFRFQLHFQSHRLYQLQSQTSTWCQRYQSQS